MSSRQHTASLSLSAIERAQLDALRSALEPACSAERAAGRDFPEVLGESSLLRFLRAAAHDVSKAATTFRESLSLRERLGANVLRRRLFSPDLSELWRFERLPHASRVLVAWAEFLPTGTLDRAGDVVLYFNRELCNSHEQLVAAVSRADYLEFRLAREVQMQMLLHALSLAQRRLVRQTVICDLERVAATDLICYAASPSIKEYRGTFDTKESFLLFPETGARLFVVNAPLVIAPAFSLLRKLLPEATLQKYAFPGKAYRATLLEAIEPGSLPQAYGGTLVVRLPAELVGAEANRTAANIARAAPKLPALRGGDALLAAGAPFEDAPEYQAGDREVLGARRSLSWPWMWWSHGTSNLTAAP